MQQKKPNFQPLSFIPTMIQLVNQELEQDKDQLQLLHKAKDQPHLLDDAIVDRILKVYKSKLEMFPVYEQQVQVWLDAPNADKHKKDIEYISKTVQELISISNKIYELTKEVSEGTIDKVMQKSDAELGLEYLLKMFEKER